MTTYLIAKSPFSPAGGGNLPGLTPVWLGYFSAVTGLPLSPPAITQSETWEGYQWTQDTNACGMISWGSVGPLLANPPYSFIPAINIATFALYDNYGVPLAGQVVAGTLSWASIEDTATGLAPVVTPTFVEYGNGCYGIVGWANTYVGTLLCSATNYGYQNFGLSAPGSGSGTGLTITVVSTMPILPTQPLVVQVVDPSGANRACVLNLQFPSPTASWEEAWNGSKFAPAYASQSKVDFVSNNVTLFTLYRNAAPVAGWPNSSFAIEGLPLSPT